MADRVAAIPELKLLLLEQVCVFQLLLRSKSLLVKSNLLTLIES